MLAMYEKHGQPLEKIVGNIIKAVSYTHLKKAEGKVIGYQRWASNCNLKQMASSLNLYTEYGFSSPEELDAAVKES